MRFRALILAVAVAALVGAALAGCSKSDNKKKSSVTNETTTTSASTTVDTSDSAKTVSLDEWVATIEAACQPAIEEIGKVETPAALQSVGDPSKLTDEQLAEIAAYLEEFQTIFRPAVESVADAGTPDEMADLADQYLALQGNLPDEVDAIIASAQSGDLEQFQADFEQYQTDGNRSGELESQLGIDCESSG